MTVYLLGTLDTKGDEVAFVRELLRELGVTACVMDTGCLGNPTCAADIPRETVFQAAGESLVRLQEQQDRGTAISVAAQGAAKLVADAHASGKLSGLLALGGSAGTTIGTTAMRGLPLGVPKLMVSTLASGQTRPYVGGKDILMLNAVVDIAGINRISRTILSQAAKAMAGMVLLPSQTSSSQIGSAAKHSPVGTASFTESTRPLIAATMFGVTTPCVQAARGILEEAGYEVIIFHATGNGGEAMEGLIADGMFAGVLDITTTELADELVGGILSAGPSRLTAAARHGIPQVISVGALDMVNFGPPETIPEKFKDRLFYQHNPNVTLMRTTVEENRLLGEEIGRKAASSTGPVSILFPQQGVSAIDRSGQPFDDPAARLALLAGLRATRDSVELTQLDRHINDPEFAWAAAQMLLTQIALRGSSTSRSM